jgi:hypothetical protein
MTTSHTIDLVDDQLVIVGFNTQSDTWQFIRLDDSRGGLLANHWISSNMIGKDSPRTRTIPRHVSYVKGQHLNILGGNQNRPTQIDLGNLNTFHFVNEDGTLFNGFPSDACGVRTDIETYVVIGGLVDNNNVSQQVFEINTKTLTVTERPPVKHARAHHSCALVSQSTILVAGGVSGQTLISDPSSPVSYDELYNVITGESEELAVSMVTPRSEHQLIRLGESVFALGGRAANRSQLTSVERFDESTMAWTEHTKGLLSNDTAGLAVTAFPPTAVDCLVDCHCGRLKAEIGSGRIIGGNEVWHGNFVFCAMINSIQTNSTWVALLLIGSSDLEYSRCSSTLVSCFILCPSVLLVMIRLEATGR